jgi:hypothetical protein
MKLCINCALFIPSADKDAAFDSLLMTFRDRVITSINC